MAESNLNFDKDVLPVVKRRAESKFAFYSDREERIADAVSESWRITQNANPKATPGSIAFAAVVRVACGVHFIESAVSLTGPNPHRVTRPSRSGEEFDLVGNDDDPADLAALRVDFAEWFAQRNQRSKAILMALLNEVPIGGDCRPTRHYKTDGLQPSQAPS